MALAYVIEANEIMSELMARYLRGITEVKTFNDVISAISRISDDKPDMIFLDVLLTGPDGFTFLNELVSYDDTSKIPVVIVSSIGFNGKDLSPYGVVGVLDKCSMKPEDVVRFVRKYEE